MWNRRLRRGQERDRDRAGGAQAARVPRLRLGGRGGDRARGAADPPGRRAHQGAGGHSPRAADRRPHRARPHPLGDPRPAHRRERAPAHRRLRRPGRGAQRHHRELPADQGAPAGRGPRLQVGDGHRGHRPPDRAASQGHPAPGRGGPPRPARAARLLRDRGAPPPDARPPGGGQARRGQRGGGARRERDLPRLRHPGHPLPHPRRGRAGGRGRRDHHPRRASRSPTSTAPRCSGPRAGSCGTRSWPRRAATATSC